MAKWNTAAGAIGAEMRLLAAERRAASFELVVTSVPMWVWHCSSNWYASFDDGPDSAGEMKEAWLIEADTTALKEAGGYRRATPGIVDLVAADTAEAFHALVHALQAEAR